MFTIFEDEKEPLTERDKVDELLSKVQAASTLSAAIAQLCYQLNTVGVPFTVAANHLNSEISQTSDYQLARKVSAIGTSGGRGGNHTGGRSSGRGCRGGRSGGRGRGGRGSRGSYDKANPGYYSAAEWEKFPYEERDKIRKERDKKGEQRGSKSNISELSTKQLTTALISSL